MFYIDFNLVARAHKVIDVGLKGTEKKTCVETGVGEVFQGTTYNDTLYDGKMFSCCIPVV